MLADMIKLLMPTRLDHQDPRPEIIYKLMVCMLFLSAALSVKPHQPFGMNCTLMYCNNLLLCQYLNASTKRISQHILSILLSVGTRMQLQCQLFAAIYSTSQFIEYYLTTYLCLMTCLSVGTGTSS